MQAIPHSMAHRGANATRTNARWHPYTPPRAPVVGSSSSTPHVVLASSSSHHHQHNSQEAKYLITPAPTVYSISPATTTFSQSPHPLASVLQQTAPQPLKPSVQVQRTAKANYVASLVDQAVKSLTDIWRPENIPPVFSTQTDITVVANKPQFLHSPCQNLKRHSVQLPSPSSPTTLPSPPPVPTLALDPTRSSSSTSSVFPSAFVTEHFGSNTTAIVSEKDLVPIRTFVQEVLRRSRTTCSVLQSALCYIEAVRNKVPELAEKEKCGMGVRGEPALDERITKEDEADAASKMNNYLNLSSLLDLRTELMSLDPFDALDAPTVVQKDVTLAPQGMMNADGQANDKRRKIPAKPLMPLPPLPSPLLCPRRTFLAALILASKFLQDRCYSNRAWAKLSGLPPREVGRCERALGDALGWRLWVGKGAAAPKEEKRSIHRSRSEGTVALESSPFAPSLNATQFPSPPTSNASHSPDFAVPAQTEGDNKPLKRAATMPDETSMRNSSMPFSFNVPPVDVIALHQQAAIAAQQSLLSSSLMSQMPLPSDPMLTSLEEQLSGVIHHTRPSFLGSVVLSCQS